MKKKYAGSMPLYHQEKKFARFGVKLSRQIMANWMIYCAETWLRLIYDRMYAYLLNQNILCADEITLQVLKERQDVLRHPLHTNGCTTQDDRVRSIFFRIISGYAQARIPGNFLKGTFTCVASGL